ncbi:MAG: hypothetical protein NE334_20160 [Lentisphaeraceae bacterium]|nr:hypothetical protein [Lentisphaeraceae bacterium]
MFTKYILLITVLSINTLRAQENFHKERLLTLRLEFKIDRYDETAKSLVNIVKACQERLNTSFKKVDAHTPMLYVFLDGPPPSKDYFNIIYFKRKDLETMNQYTLLTRVMSKMLHRTVVSLGGSRKTPVPDWFIAGMAFNLNLKNILSTEEKYPLTRLSVVNSRFPNIDQLLDKKAPDTKGYWVYRMYAENCSVFLSALQKLSEHKQSLVKILLNYNQEGTSHLVAKYYPQLKDRPSRQRWFNKTSQDICFHVINPYPPEVILNKVEDLFSITSIRPSADKVSKIPLEKLFEDEDQEINYAVIGFIEKGFYKLILTSPAILRDSMALFIEALQSLKQNEREEFAEKVKTAREKFNKAVKKQRLMINYTEELEQKSLDKTSNITEVLRALYISDLRFKEYFPKWVNYLNLLEKKLEDTIIE